MKGVVLLITTIFTVSAALQAQGEYAASKIPPPLLKNADAVLRLEDMQFEIINTRQTVTKYRYVVTILNGNGDHWAEYSDYYDKYRSIESVEGILYDANGKQLKKVKKKDLEDLTGSSGGSFADDDRIKRHNFYYKAYPYTVEYFSEVITNGTLFFPRWVPQGGERLSVENSSMHIVCPRDYQFRYKAFMYNREPEITFGKNTKQSTWSSSNMMAIVKEPFSPLWHELTTVVIYGPTDFELDNYKGTMSSWREFGKFVYSLKKDRDQLPGNVKQMVHQIADGVSDPFEKVSRLYKYMQSHTRYVGIQLGIGGWQPFDATYVATKKYGDCKALTNYMYSLLKEAGVFSYYTLVRAGEFSKYITADFPSQQFTHVILCVPNQKDTIWLECTSQTIQPGYLGDFTCDRPVLLIGEDGGQLVNTPRYGINDNLQSRYIRGVLEANSTLEVNTKTVYSGLQQDEIHSMITQLSKEKIKEVLDRKLDFPTYSIRRFDYQEEKRFLPGITESLGITVSNYASISGKRLFIMPNVMSRYTSKLSIDSTRNFDIRLNREYRETDTVEIEIPAGFESESMPVDVTVDSKFGRYNCSVKLEGNRLIYFRSLEHRGGRYPASDYRDLVKFYDAVFKNDHNKVVLVKKDGANAF